MMITSSKYDHDPRHFRFVRDSGLPRSAFAKESHRGRDIAMYSACVALFVVLLLLVVR